MIDIHLAGHELLYVTHNSDVVIHNVKTSNITTILANSSYVSAVRFKGALLSN